MWRRGVRAEVGNNWPDSARWYGAVAGWNMCVLRWGRITELNVQVSEEMDDDYCTSPAV